MNRTRHRRTAFGVESLERRDLAAIYMEVQGLEGNVTAGTQSAEVEVLDLTQGSQDVKDIYLMQDFTNSSSDPASTASFTPRGSQLVVTIKDGPASADSGAFAPAPPRPAAADGPVCEEPPEPVCEDVVIVGPPGHVRVFDGHPGGADTGRATRLPLL